MLAAVSSSARRSALAARPLLARRLASVSAYDAEFSRSLEDPSGFWLDQAKELSWSQAPTQGVTAVDAAAGQFKWFDDGRINATRVCVDEHAATIPDQPALVYESAVSGPNRVITYRELKVEVDRLAAVLRAQGIGKGDAVVLYMPMIPETAFAMLACAKLGAVHSVVFGGFAAHELAVRVNDCKAKAILAASCGIEGPGRVIPYKPLLDEAIELSDHKPDAVVLLQRPECEASMVPGRDLDWASEVEARAGETVDAVEVASNHPLYYLYTSGSTGQPKGVVRGTGDYLTALNYSLGAVYGVNRGETWWAASDFGWVVGHSYILWGPLARGMTSVIFEGKPVGTPDAGEFWRVMLKHDVKAMFTAPTAIRAIKKEDHDAAMLQRELERAGVDKLPLRTLFLAGERSDPDTVRWAMDKLGVPAVDHYWQTESGWPIIANCVGLGALPVKPGSSCKPVPGWDVRVLRPSAVDQGADGTGFFGIDASTHPKPGEAPPAPHTPAEAAHEALSPHPVVPEAADNELGPLVFRLPLPPGALTSLLNGEKRMRASYLNDHAGYFTAGDAAMRDEDGYIHIMARVDDVLNVAGHRLSTGGLEAAIATADCVAESAIIGPADELKGQVPVALVVLKANRDLSREQVAEQVVRAVRKEVGAVASLRAGQVVVVDRLPKTRSGKVLRATMKAIADGTPFKVPATIDDPAIIGEITNALATIGYPPAKGAGSA